jgi:hypothetical protein
VDLIGNRQPVLKWRGIRLRGLCQNFRAIDGDGNLPDFKDTALRGHFQNWAKARWRRTPFFCRNVQMVS